MNTEPIVKEVHIKASPAKVWAAITNPIEMQKWYFDLPTFRPEVGFRFEFWGGTEENQYLHQCEIIDAIPCQKLSYTWVYHGFEGSSKVSFELIPDGDNTLVRLTHEGIHTFAEENKDFAKSNFDGGWEAIIKDSLRNHVEHYS